MVMIKMISMTDNILLLTLVVPKDAVTVLHDDDDDDGDGDDEGGRGESVAGENFRTLYNLVIFLARCKIRQKDKKRREKRDHLVIFLVRPLQNCHDDDRKASKEVNIVKLVKMVKQACKPRRFNNTLKLCSPTDLA